MLDHAHTRTSSVHQSISAHPQLKLCRRGEGKHAVCVSREEDCLPPRSRRSRASTTTCRIRRLSSSRQVRVRVVCVCVWRMLQSRLRRGWQGSRSRHYLCPIPSARGEALGLCQRNAGNSKSSTSTPMIHVYVLRAHSGEIDVSDARVLCLALPQYLYCLLPQYLHCFRLVSMLVASHDMCVKPKIRMPFSDGDFIRKWTPLCCWRPTRKRYRKIET